MSHHAAGAWSRLLAMLLTGLFCWSFLLPAAVIAQAKSTPDITETQDEDAGTEQKPAAPDKGNSPAAKACQKDGYTHLYRADGSGFASVGDCVSYAAAGGTFDYDDDGDGIANTWDNCPGDANPGQEDTDEDTIGDVCDPTPTGDTDADGIDNATDNCPSVANADQLDSDSDGTGDACDETPLGATVAGCWAAATALGLNPVNYNLVVGTEGEDGFGSGLTAGPDLICGFGGIDHVADLDAGDVFLGGASIDLVTGLDGGTFFGGADGDRVNDMQGGTFNGGPGADSTNALTGGTFNGEGDNDSVNYMQGGTFNGGDGADFVSSYVGGTLIDVP